MGISESSQFSIPIEVVDSFTTHSSGMSAETGFHVVVLP